MYIVNDRPRISIQNAGPGTTPTLKLARHGGGTIGGPVRVYTGNPVTYVHQGNQVIAHETVHLAHPHGFEPMPSNIEYHRFAPQVGGHSAIVGGSIERPGGIAWPDTTVGSFQTQRLMGAGSYPPQPGYPGYGRSATATSQHAGPATGVNTQVVWGEASHQGMMTAHRPQPLRPSMNETGQAPVSLRTTNLRSQPARAPQHPASPSQVSRPTGLRPRLSAFWGRLVRA